jgi:nitrilase
MPKPKKLLASCVQMKSTPDKEANLFKMRDLLKEAVSDGAKFVAFPENCTILTDDSREYHAAIEWQNGPTVRLFSEWARGHKVWLLIGSMPLWPRPSFRQRIKKPLTSRSGRATNSSLLFDPMGQLISRYDKIHLFDVHIAGDRRYSESDHVLAGHKPEVAKTPWGPMGLSVCYDLRFPELYRKYADSGATMLSIPAAFTKVTGAAHWDVLTRARAIENQCFVFCAAQTGKPHPGRETYGHTRIIDPWGVALAEKAVGEGVVSAELDFSELVRIRKELPALKHRKL